MATHTTVQALVVDGPAAGDLVWVPIETPGALPYGPVTIDIEVCTPIGPSRHRYERQPSPLDDGPLWHYHHIGRTPPC